MSQSLKREREDVSPDENAPNSKAARVEGREDSVHPLHARPVTRKVDAACVHFGGFTHHELTQAFRMSYDVKERERTKENRATYARLLALAADADDLLVDMERHLQPLCYTFDDCYCGYCCDLFGAGLRYHGPDPYDGCFLCLKRIEELHSDDEDEFEAKRVEDVLCNDCYELAMEHGMCKNCDCILDEDGDCNGRTLDD